MADYCVNSIEIRGELKQLRKFINFHYSTERPLKQDDGLYSELRTDKDGYYLLYINEDLYKPLDSLYVKSLSEVVGDITLTHTYAAIGVGLCGITVYENGGLAREEICKEFSYENVPKYVSDSFLFNYGS